MKAQSDFMMHLKASERVHEVETIESCEIILAFCVVTFRGGINIDACLKNIQGNVWAYMNACCTCQVWSLRKLMNYVVHFAGKEKPIILLMLHRTFERDLVVADNGGHEERAIIRIVDLLFNEDEGLLHCPQNEKALNTVKMQTRKYQNNFCNVL